MHINTLLHSTTSTLSQEVLLAPSLANLKRVCAVLIKVQNFGYSGDILVTRVVCLKKAVSVDRCVCVSVVDTDKEGQVLDYKNRVYGTVQKFNKAVVARWPLGWPGLHTIQASVCKIEFKSSSEQVLLKNVRWFLLSLSPEKTTTLGTPFPVPLWFFCF